MFGLCDSLKLPGVGGGPVQIKKNNYQFFHRGPTCARSLPARCGSASDTAECPVADGTVFESCLRSRSLGYFPLMVSCSPGKRET